MHSYSDSVERQRNSNTDARCGSGGPQSVHPAWTEEKVRVFLAPVIGVGHRRTDGCDLGSVGKRSSEKNAFINCLHESVQEAAVIALRRVWVHFVDLHASVHQVDGVCDDSCGETTGDACHDHPVHTCSSSGVRIDFVVEVAEGPNASSCVRHCANKETIESGVELANSSTSIVDFATYFNSVPAALERNSRKELAFLQHLRADLDQIKWLNKSVRDERHGVGCQKALHVHSLVPVAPVLNFLL